VLVSPNAFAAKSVAAHGFCSADPVSGFRPPIAAVSVSIDAYPGGIKAGQAPPVSFDGMTIIFKHLAHSASDPFAGRLFAFHACEEQRRKEAKERKRS
jgi:hypothetical protein